MRSCVATLRNQLVNCSKVKASPVQKTQALHSLASPRYARRRYKCLPCLQFAWQRHGPFSDVSGSGSCCPGFQRWQLHDPRHQDLNPCRQTRSTGKAVTPSRSEVMLACWQLNQYFGSSHGAYVTEAFLRRPDDKSLCDYLLGPRRFPTASHCIGSAGICSALS